MSKKTYPWDNEKLTLLLNDWLKGNEDAGQEALSLVYEHLKLEAKKRLGSERFTEINTTQLLHDALVVIVDKKEKKLWENRNHFFNSIGTICRHLLVDDARKRLAKKHGAGSIDKSLEPQDAIFHPNPEKLIQAHEALDALGKKDPVAAKVVELKFFSGLTIMQISEALGIPRIQVERKWEFSRRWLARFIDNPPFY